MTATTPITPPAVSTAQRGARALPILLLIVVLALLPLTLPNDYYFDVAILIAANATVGVTLNLLIGYTGHLGHAGFFGLGAYGSAILTTSNGYAPGSALLLSAPFVGALAYLVARAILRQQGHYLAMATLGLGVIVTIVLTNESAVTGGPDGMAVPDFTLFGQAISGERAWY